MELLILPEPDGTHAKVRFAGVVSEPPADAQRVGPGGSLDGIPYDAWRARTGQRVDVAALRVRLAAEVEEERSPAAHDDALGLKPPGLGPYGFVHNGRKSAMTREGLRLRCAGLEPPEAVWTPGSPWLQLPEEVPYLREAMAERGGGKALVPLAGVCWGVAAVLAVAGVAGVIRPLSLALFLAILVVVVSLLFLMVRRSYHEDVARRLDPAQAAAHRERTRYFRWLLDQPITYARYLAWLIAAMGICQLLTGRLEDSVAAAGLVKPLVRDGELWRMATAALLHAGPVHLWYNYVALEALGRQVEAHAHRIYVPIVFVVAALAGSAASTLLIATPSVGASGGIMGLLGFLIVVTRRLPSSVPPWLHKGLWGVVGANAVIGVVGFFLIDNAAHAGGLLAGLAMGAAAPLREGADGQPVPPGPRVRSAGILAAGVIVATAVFTALRLSGGTTG